MQSLSFRLPEARPAVVLCLGAHCDDIELGCAGTLLRLLEARPDTEIRWVILSSTPQRREETLTSARGLLGEDALDRVTMESFRDGWLPWEGARIKEHFEGLKASLQPDLIFTHWRDDRHQDHRLVSDLTWSTWRDHLILEYEIPKYDGDLGQPGTFVALEEHHVRRKVEGLLGAYASQRDKQWFDADTLRGLMRLRGLEANAPGRYAEAFHARKLVLRF